MMSKAAIQRYLNKKKTIRQARDEAVANWNGDCPHCGCKLNDAKKV